jgi:ribosomal protein L37AE/L43A
MGENNKKQCPYCGNICSIRFPCCGWICFKCGQSFLEEDIEEEK